MGNSGRDVTGSVPDERPVEFKPGAVGMSGGRLRLTLGSGRLVGRIGGIEMLTLGSGRVRDGGSNEGRDSDGSGSDSVDGFTVEVGTALESETFALVPGGREMIGDEGTESVGNTSEGLPEGPPKLRDAEAEGRLAHVEGRGIPDGRLHVRFCADAVAETLNRASPTSTSMMSRSNSPKKPQGFRCHTRSVGCTFSLLYNITRLEK